MKIRSETPLLAEGNLPDSAYYEAMREVGIGAGLFNVRGERLISEEVRARGWTNGTSVCDNAESEGERDCIA